MFLLPIAEAARPSHRRKREDTKTQSVRETIAFESGRRGAGGIIGSPEERKKLTCGGGGSGAPR